MPVNNVLNVFNLLNKLFGILSKTPLSCPKQIFLTASLLNIYLKENMQIMEQAWHWYNDLLSWRDTKDEFF